MAIYNGKYDSKHLYQGAALRRKRSIIFMLLLTCTIASGCLVAYYVSLHVNSVVSSYFAR